eukprot:1171851-Amphidinium_carterae.1
MASRVFCKHTCQCLSSPSQWTALPNPEKERGYFEGTLASGAGFTSQKKRFNDAYSKGLSCASALRIDCWHSCPNFEGLEVTCRSPSSRRQDTKRCVDGPG